MKREGEQPKIVAPSQYGAMSKTDGEGLFVVNPCKVYYLNRETRTEF